MLILRPVSSSTTAITHDSFIPVFISFTHSFFGLVIIVISSSETEFGHSDERKHERDRSREKWDNVRAVICNESAAENIKDNSN
jgi:hypothetical protein